MELQHKLYADGRFSYLIILQWLDASGKDGLITKVLGAINPMGCSVKSFGVPTKEELAHDFLWRIHKETPAKGTIKVFNRSHYEDLVMPQINGTMTKKEYQRRLEAIKNFEQLLVDNGTIIIKCFLHVSAEKQREKLEERMIDPKKHRKHKDDDFRKASEYDKYIDIYSDVLTDTSWDHAPWHIIGTDENFSKEYEFATILLASLKKLPLKWPKLETSMHVLKAVKQNMTERKKEKKKKKKKENTDTLYEDTKGKKKDILLNDKSTKQIHMTSWSSSHQWEPQEKEKKDAGTEDITVSSKATVVKEKNTPHILTKRTQSVSSVKASRSSLIKADVINDELRV